MDRLEGARKRRIQYVGCWLGVIMVLLLAYVLKSLGYLALPCYTYELTGFSCPGCGITRMVNSLLELDIYQAFRYNPFAFLSIPFGIYMFFACGKVYIVEGRLNARLSLVLQTYAISVIIFGILRNIGWFRILLPTRII